MTNTSVLTFFSYQGDRLVIGDHYFRFNHPLQVQRARVTSHHQSNTHKDADFEFARNELVAKQTAQ